MDVKNILKFLSTTAQRSAIARQLGQSYGGDRDLYTALGYKTDPTYSDFMARYTRQDISTAVVNAPVDASWRVPPRITESEEDETAFEIEWNALVKSQNIYQKFVRADKLAGIGSYSVLLLGFDDTGELKDEVTSAKELIYLQPYGKSNAAIKEYVKDTKDPRFGLPFTYSIEMKQDGGTNTRAIVVHYTRIIHIAENLLEDNVEGEPRLQNIYNRLEDLERVVGGSAEMFWRGAFPGYNFKADENFDLSNQSLDEITDEIEEYMHGLKRYLKLKNVSVEDLAQQVSDPSKHVDAILTLISAATRIPKRILLGSERGELASSMDERNWLQIIESRRNNYCEPTLVRALIDRLIELSVLTTPKEGYLVEWSDLMAPSDKEVAEVGAVRAKAIKDYVSTPGADIVIPPEIFFRKIMGFSDEVINEINIILDGIKDEVD